MTNPNHTDTSRSDDLVASLRALSAWLIAKNLDLKLPDEIGDPDDAADRIEALEAENEWLDHLLAGRDSFIANKGLLDEFVEWIRDEPARAALGKK